MHSPELSACATKWAEAHFCLFPSSLTNFFLLWSRRMGTTISWQRPTNSINSIMASRVALLEKIVFYWHSKPKILLPTVYDMREPRIHFHAFSPSSRERERRREEPIMKSIRADSLDFFFKKITKSSTKLKYFQLHLIPMTVPSSSP